jgi:hypothetical protein
MTLSRPPARTPYPQRGGPRRGCRRRRHLPTAALLLWAQVLLGLLQVQPAPWKLALVVPAGVLLILATRTMAMPPRGRTWFGTTPPGRHRPPADQRASPDHDNFGGQEV